MENEIENKLLEKAKTNNKRVLIVSKEGNFTFSAKGLVEEFDNDVISLDIGEVIRRSSIIKIKILNGD